MNTRNIEIETDFEILGPPTILNDVLTQVHIYTLEKLVSDIEKGSSSVEDLLKFLSAATGNTEDETEPNTLGNDLWGFIKYEVCPFLLTRYDKRTAFSIYAKYFSWIDTLSEEITNADGSINYETLQEYRSSLIKSLNFLENELVGSIPEIFIEYVKEMQNQIDERISFYRKILSGGLELRSSVDYAKKELFKLIHMRYSLISKIKKYIDTDRIEEVSQAKIVTSEAPKVLSDNLVES